MAENPQVNKVYVVNQGGIPITGALTDRFGFYGQFNPVHSLQVAEPYRLAGTSFGATIDTNFWTAANGGGAGAASGVASSIATIASGTASGATGYGKLTTVRSARFVFAHPHKWRGAIRVTSVAVTNSSSRGWGPVTLSTVTPQDGPFFSVNAAGTVSCCHAKAGSTTAVASGSWSGGSVNSFTLDTNVHAYEIIYFTMGIWYYIDGVLVHVKQPTTATLYDTLSTPINIWSVNDGTGGTTGVVECWNSVITRLGRDITASLARRITGNAATYTFKIGAGILHKIIFNNTSGTTVTFYDALTAVGGTEMMIITTAAAALGPWEVNLPFYTGLTIVTVGNGLDATILLE